MTIGVLHIDDVALSLSLEAQVSPVYAEPAFAWFQADASIVTGSKAYRAQRLHPRSVKNRYVYGLSTERLKDQRFNRLSSADLLAEQLEQAWSAADGQIDQLFIATPGSYGTIELGVLLGVAAELELPVAGLVDTSVAVSTLSYPDCQLYFLDVSLHTAIISALDQEKVIRLRAHREMPELGLASLQNAWLARVASAFVEQSRFDPLHSAEAEQGLFDRLPQWLEAAGRESRLTLQMTFDGRDYEATLDSLEFINVVSDQYQLLADGLRAMYSAGTDAVVQVLQRTAKLPGLVDYLRARTNVEIQVLDDQAVSRGALGRSVDILQHGFSSLLLELPASAVADRRSTPSSVGAGDGPTHLLYRSRAYPLHSDPLLIGAGEGGDGRRLGVDELSAGVSKLHCALQADSAECVVSDHSRYGTYLNGNRINGSAVLQVGDILRVGTPGHEFELIRVTA